MRSMIFLAIVLTFASSHYVSAWMSNIPDNKYLYELTIPGTHQSYARYGNNAFAAPFAICQDWTVKKQLEEGIRFFDVRFRPFRKGFTVHHGAIWQKKDGEDVFREFTDFLKRNPRETLLISYKDETNGNPTISPEPGSDDFKSILTSHLYNNRYTAWVYGFSRGEIHNKMPTLGQARGKMVLIDKHNDGGWGITSSLLAVKDNWKASVKVNWNDILNPELNNKWFQQKVNGIKTNMRYAKHSKSKLYLSYLSASAAPLGPSNRQIANLVNPKVESFARMNGWWDRPFGVVIMDFPTSEFIKTLIYCNAGDKWILIGGKWI